MELKANPSMNHSSSKTKDDNNISPLRSDIQPENNFYQIKSPKHPKEEPSKITFDSPFYESFSPLMQMMSIPYLGIYSNEYIFMTPLIVLKSKSQPKYLPPGLLKQLSNIKEAYPSIIPEYYHITCDASMAYQSFNQRITNNSYIRTNIIPHPFLFNEVVHLEKGHYTNVHIGVFTDDVSPNYIQETGCNDDIKWNTFENWLTTEVSVHPIYIHSCDGDLPAISPNNCAIDINLNNQFIKVSILILGSYNSPTPRWFIGEYILIPNPDRSKLFSHLSKILNGVSDEKLVKKGISMSQWIYNDIYLNIMKYYNNQIENALAHCASDTSDKDIFLLLFNLFKSVYETDFVNYVRSEYDEDMNNIVRYYLDDFFNYISKELLKYESSVENEEKVFHYIIKNKMICGLLNKYSKYHLKLVNDIYNSYSSYWNSGDVNGNKNEYALNVWPGIIEKIIKTLKINQNDFTKSIECNSNNASQKEDTSNKSILIEIKEEISLDKRKQLVHQLDPLIKEMVFYNAWKVKGSVCNVSDNWGELIMYESEKIDKMYYWSNDERKKVVNEVMSAMKRWE